MKFERFFKTVFIFKLIYKIYYNIQRLLYPSILLNIVKVISQINKKLLDYDRYCYAQEVNTEVKKAKQYAFFNKDIILQCY